ncbi:DsbA family protein [Marinovum sp.]|uniref:DsbA family protein n=1 Tax=Marinovum sp. TaxID=2024839 RepID=UPI002B26A7E2|nr:DsbA family protein [Marinovum sp.]
MYRFLTSTALAATLLAGPALATDLTDMTEAESAAFGAAVRAYLMENPEVIIEAVNALEQRQQAAQGDRDVDLIAANRGDIFDDGFSHVGGNPKGDVTLVEFIDYRCGYCRKAHEEVKELIESDGNIRFIVKEFPILGPDSLESSKFAIAAGEVAGEDAYMAAHEALINFGGTVNEAALRRLAETLELDAAAVLAEMESDTVAERIAETRALAQRLQINGTPTFVLDETLLRGYLPLDAMRQVVEESRAEG